MVNDDWKYSPLIKEIFVKCKKKTRIVINDQLQTDTWLLEWRLILTIHTISVEGTAYTTENTNMMAMRNVEVTLAENSNLQT